MSVVNRRNHDVFLYAFTRLQLRVDSKETDFILLFIICDIVKEYPQILYCQRGEKYVVMASLCDQNLVQAFSMCYVRMYFNFCVNEFRLFMINLILNVCYYSYIQVP